MLLGPAHLTMALRLVIGKESELGKPAPSLSSSEEGGKKRKHGKACDDGFRYRRVGFHYLITFLKHSNFTIAFLLPLLCT